MKVPTENYLPGDHQRTYAEEYWSTGYWYKYGWEAWRHGPHLPPRFVKWELENFGGNVVDLGYEKDILWICIGPRNFEIEYL